MVSGDVVCGIDPGLAGAIAFISDRGEFVAVYDMPTLKSTTGRRLVDAHAVAEILRLHTPAFALVERVGARPDEGAVGAFGFGQSFGVVLGILATLSLPHMLIQPAVWKKRVGIPAGAGKSASISIAKQLIPSAATQLTRVKDDGRAEALLLALEGRRMNFQPISA